jgi:hypothetical protein
MRTGRENDEVDVGKKTHEDSIPIMIRIFVGSGLIASITRPRKKKDGTSPEIDVEPGTSTPPQDETNKFSQKHQSKPHNPSVCSLCKPPTSPASPPLILLASSFAVFPASSFTVMPGTTNPA